MSKIWFDFRDFPKRVAELNRLNQAVADSSDLRWRTRRPADIAVWEAAVSTFTTNGTIIKMTGEN